MAIVMTSLNFFFKDFEDFDIANEDDVLEEFLGLERSKPKVPQLIKRGIQFMQSDFIYMSTMKILITSDRTGQNGSSCSRGEQVESWQTRSQGGGKVKQRKR